MNRINPSDYEYLWTDYGDNFIFASCYLFDQFKKSNIIIAYKYSDKGFRFYLLKKQHEIFTEEGVDFFENDFEKWLIRIRIAIKDSSQLLRNIEDLKNRIEDLSNKMLSEYILEVASHFKELASEYFHTEFFFLDKIEKNKNLLNKLQDKIEEMTKIKLEARNVLNRFYNYEDAFKPFIEEAKRRTGRNDLEWLNPENVVAVLAGEIVPYSDLDKINWVLAFENGWKVLRGSEAGKILADFDNHFFASDVDQLKGMIANKGIYKGRAKIIRTIFGSGLSDELSKVEDSDVMVAETTGPEMMIACKRAGAIVTDQGGITSHAAIISRELRIPCVIGTKIASKVLKDGDIVEVDADKGIVKILERADVNNRLVSKIDG